MATNARRYTPTHKKMKKKELKKDEIAWQKFKLVENGGKGLDLKYSFLFDEQGRKFVKVITSENDLPPHDDLIRLFKSLRPIVAKIENIDYARRLMSLPGFEPTKIQLELTEATVQESMQSIEVTGITLSERRKEDGVIISYNKNDVNDMTTGTSTTWISLESEIYAIEEDLSDIIAEIKTEAYEYEFGSKYADFEQMTMQFDNNEEEHEEAEVVVDEP